MTRAFSSYSATRRPRHRLFLQSNCLNRVYPLQTCLHPYRPALRSRRAATARCRMHFCYSKTLPSSAAQKRRRQNPPPLRCRHRRSTPLGRLAPSLLHDIPRRARPRPSAPSRLSRPGAAPHGSTRAVFAETTGSRRARLRFPRSTPPRARLRRAWVYYALGHPLARFAPRVIFAF